MTKIKTADLTGPALDWTVAKCEGWRVSVTEFRKSQISSSKFAYSSVLAKGGPIIELEKITVVCAEGDYNPSKAGTSECYDTYWVATRGKLSASTVYGPQGDNWGECFQIDADAVQGPTPLIAAMRCFVASKLGDEVDVPEELLS